MPGGGMGGGLGGLFGGMMRGPGGGMGGMNKMGGFPGGTMQGNSGGQSPGGAYADVYDVDRWKRADGIDAEQPTPSAVQAVRDAWDKKEAKKKERSLLRKLKKQNSKWAQKKKQKEEEKLLDAVMEHKPGGTVKTPEMKKAVHHIESVEEEVQQKAGMQEQKAHPAETGMDLLPDGYPHKKNNYLGLETTAHIDRFFTENPVNSTLLAVDTLSQSSLLMNQIRYPALDMGLRTEENARLQKAAPQLGPAPAAAAASQNLIAQRTGTDYMNAMRETREQKKYEVHIV